jgi:5'-nucleotidase
MKFLLTNDDGIYAKGLYALYEELSKIAECVVVAPETEQSAIGHAISISRPLMVRTARRNGGNFGYAVSGTPADCVKIGIMELAGTDTGLVVSGINRGANVGTNVIYSGTVSAATEGAIMGIPSMAVSLDSLDKDADFSVAARFAAKMARFVTEHKLFHGIPLNINVPALPESEIKGVVVAKQGRARLVESFEKRLDPRKNVYYWMTGETQLCDQEDGQSDCTVLKQGMITVTPIFYDLTRHDVLPDLDKNLGAYLKRKK